MCIFVEKSLIYFSEENDLDVVMERIDRVETQPGIGNSDRELVKYHIEKKTIENKTFGFTPFFSSNMAR